MFKKFSYVVILCSVFLINDVFAHHVLGRPAYSLGADSNTPPSMQIETQIGEYYVTYMAFPAFPKPNRVLTMVKPFMVILFFKLKMIVGFLQRKKLQESRKLMMVFIGKVLFSLKQVLTSLLPNSHRMVNPILLIFLCRLVNPIRLGHQELLLRF